MLNIGLRKCPCVQERYVWSADVLLCLYTCVQWQSPVFECESDSFCVLGKVCLFVWVCLHECECVFVYAYVVCVCVLVCVSECECVGVCVCIIKAKWAEGRESQSSQAVCQQHVWLSVPLWEQLSAVSFSFSPGNNKNVLINMCLKYIRFDTVMTRCRDTWHVRQTFKKYGIKMFRSDSCLSFGEELWPCDGTQRVERQRYSQFSGSFRSVQSFYAKLGGSTPSLKVLSSKSHRLLPTWIKNNTRLC